MISKITHIKNKRSCHNMPPKNEPEIEIESEGQIEQVIVENEEVEDGW